ncbi:MAG: response regulator [Reinekea sp.]
MQTNKVTYDLVNLPMVTSSIPTSNTVMGQFHLIEEEVSPEGDILLIDADDDHARESFKRMEKFKKFQSILCIRDKNHEAPKWLPTRYVITRPMVLRKVTQLFETLMEQNRIESSRHLSAYSVLVVDDSLPVRTFMKQRLHDLLGQDIAVDLANNGNEALRLASRNHYNLVFLDVVMPDMDGYHVCRALKTYHPMPVVMLTSRGSTLNKVKAKMVGSNGYITKPPTDTELLGELKRFIPEAEQRQPQWQIRPQ